MITVYYNIFLAKELNALNNFLADIFGGLVGQLFVIVSHFFIYSIQIVR